MIAYSETGSVTLDSPHAPTTDQLNDRRSRSFGTRAAHPPEDPTAHSGAVVMPLYLTSTFKRSVRLTERWDYSRVGNPTRSALEECLADLENGARAIATSSGMGAISLVAFALCRAGSHVILSDNVYGGTWDLYADLLGGWNVEVTTVDMTDLAAVAAAFRADTVMVYTETPSNPLQKISDIESIAALAHSRGAALAVDSTFASPALQRPLELGADIVVQSTTKYLGGHSDVIGGAVVCRTAELGALMHETARMIGSIESPFDAWLVLRGIKTLDVRMERISATAMAVAEYLEDHPRVRRVHYPGLATHPGHDVAAAQMSAFGGIVSVELDCDADAAALTCDRFGLFTVAVSLGGTESLVEHPHYMTHCTTGTTPVRVPDSLLRLSIGLENARDLIDDLSVALRA
ncbi:cystathionine gamma-synthase [Rhodococcoides trifolii]|uniref:Cystathionine gamma-synthase n=1 Tax=Rhodococcoides trifolii TaxID=908250 RepID=A0A917LHG6_9NOCA|nr:cystathionine gamma-synthase [Rhodococcus trifolii]